MDAQILIARLLAQREVRVELEPGKAVILRRPPRAEIGKFTGGITVKLLEEFAVRWEGVTEADVLGKAVGAEDAAPFDQALWGHVVADKPEWFAAAATRLIKAINDHLYAEAAASGNSQPSST